MKLDRVIAVRNSKTVYRDGDRRIKVFHWKYSKADVLNEALNQARIEETGLSVSKILEVTTVDGEWSIVSEYVKGKTLAQLMQEEPEKRDEHIALLADLHNSIHGKACPFLTRQKDKMSQRIEMAGLSAAAKEDLKARLGTMPEQENICHGDFHPSNVIISPDAPPYILDWAQATRGNASADAARTYLLFLLDEDASLAELYLDAFCQRSGIQKQTVKEWLPLVAASCLYGANERERVVVPSICALPIRAYKYRIN